MPFINRKVEHINEWVTGRILSNLIRGRVSVFKSVIFMLFFVVLHHVLSDKFHVDIRVRRFFLLTVTPN